jgi:hypothetical protein
MPYGPARHGPSLKSPAVVRVDMDDRVKVSELETALADLEYPATRTDAATTLAGTTLVHAGGETDLGGLVSETGADSFDHPEDVVVALHNVMPESALGELGEAEGEG